ncbi:MAG: 50S ribosomal protein L29 [Nanoarchaeota archaeon]
MKITKELRALSGEELRSRKAELQYELLKMNAQVALGTNPTNPGKIGQTKKNIARIFTLLAEKQAKTVSEAVQKKVNVQKSVSEKAEKPKASSAKKK